jgi:tetratricopeptide (TPR) repeat protein
MALRAVSWQIAIVGDPLYRPFRYTLDEQIRHLEEDNHPGVAWGWLRRINTLVRNGQLNPALDYCRERLAASGSPLLREKLAELYARNGLYKEAGEAYGALLAETDSPVTAVRAAVPWIRILNALGYRRQADELAKRIRLYGPAHKYLPWFERSIRNDDTGFILNPAATATDTPGLRDHLNIKAMTEKE